MDDVVKLGQMDETRQGRPPCLTAAPSFDQSKNAGYRARVLHRTFRMHDVEIRIWNGNSACP